MTQPGEIWRLFKQSMNSWSEDRAPSMGAALAYYTAFSLAPVLLIVITIAGLVFGRDAAQGALFREISGLVGAQAAQAIQAILQNAHKTGGGLTGTIVGIAALLVGATTVFVELQDDLDHIWKVEKRSAWQPSGTSSAAACCLSAWSSASATPASSPPSSPLPARYRATIWNSSAIHWYSHDAASPDPQLHAVSASIIAALRHVIRGGVRRILKIASTTSGSVRVSSAAVRRRQIRHGLIGKQQASAVRLHVLRRCSPSTLIWISLLTQIFLLGAEFTCRQLISSAPARGFASSAGPDCCSSPSMTVFIPASMVLISRRSTALASQNFRDRTSRALDCLRITQYSCWRRHLASRNSF